MTQNSLLEEVDKLRMYIGKGISLAVLCMDTTWDYGEPTTATSTVIYGMVLDEVTECYLRGRHAADHCWGEPQRRVKKGEPVTQPFSHHIPDGVAWMGGGLRTITNITYNDEVLYQRQQ